MKEIEKKKGENENQLMNIFMELCKWNLKKQTIRAKNKLNGVKIYINEAYTKEIFEIDMMKIFSTKFSWRYLEKDAEENG